MTQPCPSRKRLRAAVASAVAVGTLGLSACSADSATESGSEPSSSPKTSTSEAGSSGKSDERERERERERPLTVAFLGDSYVEGEGAKRPETERWTTVISEKFGWREVNLGLGGTGYTTPGPEDKATTYIQRVDSVKDANPDVVVVSGGRNDVLATPQRIRAEAVKLYKTLQRLKGSPTVVVVAPLWDASKPSKRFVAATRAVQDAARRADVEFIAIRKQPLAGKSKLISKDKLHPEAAGYAVIARFLAPRLKDAVGEG